MTTALQNDPERDGVAAVGIPVGRRVRRHAQYVDAVMRQVYAATSWHNRIAEIELAVWAAVEADREENERLRSALGTIARHFSSDWPERCQSNVLTARAALLHNVEVERPVPRSARTPSSAG